MSGESGAEVPGKRLSPVGVPRGVLVAIIGAAAYAPVGHFGWDHLMKK
jgi:hypothetical protein